jgi:hypothetical protein
LDKTRTNLADCEIQAHDFNWLSYRAYSLDLGPVDVRLLGNLNIMLEGSSFEMTEELQEKLTNVLMVIPASSLRTSIEKWENPLL